MTIQGWTMLILCVGFSCTLMTWCLWKVFTEPGETEHLHSQADIDPKDRDRL